MPLHAALALACAERTRAEGCHWKLSISLIAEAPPEAVVFDFVDPLCAELPPPGWAAACHRESLVGPVGRAVGDQKFFWAGNKVGTPELVGAVTRRPGASAPMGPPAIRSSFHAADASMAFIGALATKALQPTRLANKFNPSAG